VDYLIPICPVFSFQTVEKIYLSITSFYQDCLLMLNFACRLFLECADLDLSQNDCSRVDTHQDLVETLEKVRGTEVKSQQLRSLKHQVYTIEQPKIALSPYDNKRYILWNGITTLPIGTWIQDHYLKKRNEVAEQ